MFGPSSGTGAVIYDVVDQADSAKEGEAYVLPPKHRNLDFIVQIDILDGEADVMIQGRLNEERQWKDLMSAVVGEVTAVGVAGLQGFSWVPQVIAVSNSIGKL